MPFYDTRKGVKYLYSDYELRILREKRDEAEAVKQCAHAAYNKAREHRLHAYQCLVSRRRIEQLLAGTSTPRDVAECQRLLRGYPSEEELVGVATTAAREESAALAVYSRAQAQYKQAADKASKRQELTVWIAQRYGSALTRHILERFGPIELICRCDKSSGRLDVYFGGRGQPLGFGHAHWIFNREGRVDFRRKPRKKIA